MELGPWCSEPGIMRWSLEPSTDARQYRFLDTSLSQTLLRSFS